MPISFKDDQILNQLAVELYPLLPGSGNINWKGHVSFRSLSAELGLGHYWPEGNKERAIHHLLKMTLDREPRQFEPLILRVISAGITYTRKQGSPLTKQQMEKINGCLLALGRKFPSLWEADFLDSLDGKLADRAKKLVEEEHVKEKVRISMASAASQKLEQLRNRFYALSMEANRNLAGLQLEKVLNELFEMYQLSPKGSFKIVGEQIDGSFQLDSETYLIEAKWEKDLLPEAPLLIFRGKIEGKSSFTRGAFFSVSGFSQPAITAIVTGKQPTFFLVDGYDLSLVLGGQIDLSHLLRAKRDRLAEAGSVLYRCST